MISKLSILLFIASVGCIPIEEFFPFNEGRVCLIDDATGFVHTSNVLDCNGRVVTAINPSECDEYRLSPNDDGNSRNISTSFTFPFFGKRFQNFYVSQTSCYLYIYHIRYIDNLYLCT